MSDMPIDSPAPNTPIASTPVISVVLPVYNSERYLRKALASLRWQTFPHWEAICVNDGSTDGSLAILEDYAAADPRFRVISQPNSGIVAALNRGLFESRCEWVARMDSDDIATPDRFARQIETVRADPLLVLLGGAVTTIDPEDDPLRTLRYPTDHNSIEASLLRGDAPIAHPTVLMRREAALQVGGYRPACEWVEDMDLWLRLARVGRLANLADPVLRYRLHTSSVCWTRRAEQRERMQQVLGDAHSERGLAPPPEAPPVQSKPLSDARGKWARSAARAGRLRVAAKWAGRLAAEKPLSGQTLRVGAETLLRSAVSFATGKRERLDPLPDWRQWDCLAVNPKSASKAA